MGTVETGGDGHVQSEQVDLVRILDVQADGPGRFVAAPHLERGRTVVEGSQMLAQSIVAAGRLVPGRRPVSVWMAFLRVADGTIPLEFELDVLSNGRTFSAVRVDVRQGERLCASGNVLLDVTAPDVIRHHVASRTVAAPDDCEPLDLGVAGQDVRVVDGAYSGDPDAPVGPPEIDAWVRISEVPDDPCLHAALLAQFSGYLSIAAALRPHPGHGQDDAHRSLSTAVNAISLSLHADVRADQWMLYQHHSTFAGDGMTHSECRVHDESGALLASFTVEGMVRSPATNGIESTKVL
jgi:acyl-CoA thioesterase II